VLVAFRVERCMGSWFALLMFFFLCPSSTWSYPIYIGYGYGNCRSCHFNPLGNGPLNDYGRGLAAVELADRLFSSETDDAVADRSGFAGAWLKLPSWMRVEADYRGLALVSALQSTPSFRWVHMQAEGALVLKAVEDRIFVSASLGYVPPPASFSPTQQATSATLISREHYLGLRPWDSAGIYVGFMDIAFGLRIPEHNSYIRRNNGLDMNDQAHGALLHLSGETWDLGAHAVLGNLLQSPDVRQKGGSLFLEIEAREGWRIGASGLYSWNDYRSRLLGALHSRFALGVGSSILAQVGFYRKGTSAQTELGISGFVQSCARLSRGAHGLMTFELLSENILASTPRQVRVGPGLLYAPKQWVEFRFDFLATRTFATSQVLADSLTLMSQVHVWL
jgi:hypothetical protein